MISIAFPTHGTTAAQGFMHASLSSSSSTWAWAFGSANRRSSGGRGRVVDLEHAGDGLLLEPLAARTARMPAGSPARRP